MRMRSLIVLSVLVLGACSASHHGTSPTPTTRRPVADLTTRLELQSSVVPAGGTVAGSLIVNNESGHPIATPRCTAWEVAIANDKIRPRPIEAIKCADGPVLPAGEHRYPFTADANYPCIPPPTGQCGNAGPPPLPTGNYRAELVQLGSAMPVPAPVPVTVVRKPTATTRHGLPVSLDLCQAAARLYSGVPIAAFRNPWDASRDICWVDGHMSKSPPPSPGGTIPPDFNRLELSVTLDGKNPLVIGAGYRASMPVRAPVAPTP